jgi:hypothetical protein
VGLVTIFGWDSSKLHPTSTVLCTNSLAQSPGQAKLDSDKRKLWKNFLHYQDFTLYKIIVSTTKTLFLRNDSEMKMKISNLLCTMRFWNNLHQVTENRKMGKLNNFLQILISFLLTMFAKIIHSHSHFSR